MGEQSWLIRGLRGHCLIPGLPEGEGFRLHRGDEAGGLRALPWPLIAALPPAAADPPALAGKAVALADDQDRELGLAAQPGLGDRPSPSIAQSWRIFGREKA